MVNDPLVTIIIPMYNESATIGTLLGHLVQLQGNYEIIVIDDASTDESQKIVKKFPSVKLVTHGENLGKADAIQSGLRISSGEIILIQDADLEYPTTNIPRLIEPIVKNETSVVYGRRINVESFLPVSLIAKFTTSQLVWLLFGKSVQDINTGHKVFKRSCLDRLTLSSKGFSFCVEVTIKLIQGSICILEVPIDYYPRTKREGKKISIFDGFKIVKTIFSLKLQKNGK
ncbi:glycosyltransferase family 2 protein [Halobacteriovorax sp. JY17]|uniref:glycosyltransferase family 2 protein n=1 Tax=Halobacteriovorax sp. JY17 TaxID=2014617 RepID=UPI000C3DBCF0|nr:glycosyltransferase family 2 protein [Halobacteriovorax sp. JY17]PIK14068.1 MAG: glycosyl transferase [Halobacteriovorax sp. JY17]